MLMQSNESCLLFCRQYGIKSKFENTAFSHDIESSFQLEFRFRRKEKENSEEKIMPQAHKFSLIANAI